MVGGLRTELDLGHRLGLIIPTWDYWVVLSFDVKDLTFQHQENAWRKALQQPITHARLAGHEPLTIVSPPLPI